MPPVVENSANSLDPNTSVVRQVIFLMMVPVSATSEEQIVRFNSLTCHTGVVKLDPWLAPFSDALRRRYSKAQDWIRTINDTEGGINKFSRV